MSKNYLMIGNRKIINDLFNLSETNLFVKDVMDGHRDHENIYIDLFTLLAVKFIVLILSAASPVPNGAFTPCIVVGALIGRLHGAIIGRYFDVHHL